MPHLSFHSFSFVSAPAARLSRTPALLAAGAALALAAAAVPAQAQTEVTSRAGIGSSNVIDWNQTGVELAQVASGTVVTSTGGSSAAVTTQTGSPFERLNQSSGWQGNFGPGDILLYNQNNGPVTFSFTSGISGLGAQIMANSYGPFIAQLQTFDQNGALLSTFLENGLSSGTNDNTAIFLGVLDPTADIYKATYSLTAASGAATDFAIDGISVAAPAAVPEASTTVSLGLLLALGLGGIALAAKRRKGSGPAAA